MPLPETIVPLERTSARMRVYDQLRTLIEDGVLQPSETVRDVDIAAQFGVSRTPVREAFQLLEQLGVLETLPNRHTRVTPVHPEDAALICPPLAALHGIAAREAAGRMTASDLQRMKEANAILYRSERTRDQVAAREADYLFHRIIIERADNPYLSAAIDSLQIHSRRLDTLYFARKEFIRASHHAHEAILTALASAERELAAELAALNIMQSAHVWVRQNAGNDPADGVDG
ncbi:MAG TPA: GntR family transcriptional regulator [Candidatus Acidoferrales bacterium]|nr:GntR family transcriptional regulator [Candidatus Acidoferrales bacterium]